MTSVRRFGETLLCLSLLLLVSNCNRSPKLTTESPDALRAYQEGLDQFEKFYYREAKTSFEEALRKDSTFAMAWARMAMLEWAGMDEEGARRDIATALRFSLKASEREQLFIRAWSQLINYNLPGATATVDSLIARYPEEKEPYLLRGNLYEQSKNLEGAIHSYQQAVAVDTSYAPAVMSLGYAYSRTGELEKAAAQMQKYIRLAPDAADPHASYADILVYVGRYDEALKQYTKALELKPDYWYAIRERGRIYQIEGRLKEAEEEYHASLKLLPQNRQIEGTQEVLNGYVNLDRSTYEEARQQFIEALTIDSNNYDAARGLVYALGKLKRYGDAEEIVKGVWRELVRRNLTESPSMFSFYLMRARLLTDEGNLTRALANCDSAVGYSTSVTRSMVYRQMAEIYRLQKAYDPALDACEQALQVNPNYPDALLTLVRIYNDQGDRRMTREIGNRLMDFWAHADPDYRNRIELMKILGANN
jgi:tetratricopeptide (TPR) repeat protein